MLDQTTGKHVTFNWKVFAKIKANPDTYNEHLDWAVEYHIAAYRLRAARVRLRKELGKLTTMQLRAIFLFSIFENYAERAKGERLNELERLQVWERLNRQRLVTYCANRLPVATDAAELFSADKMDTIG
jgi:hypothetical protein